MTKSELIDDISNFVLLIRCTKFISAHLLKGITRTRPLPSLIQGHSAGAQATIYCFGNIQWDHNASHSFIQ